MSIGTHQIPDLRRIYREIHRKGNSCIKAKIMKYGILQMCVLRFLSFSLLKMQLRLFPFHAEEMKSHVMGRLIVAGFFWLSGFV